VRDTQVEPQVQKIRADIAQSGESILEHKELRALCQTEISEHRWNVLARIAIDEGWSFTFFPDGRVRFAKL
jgi:hypothetical protein